MPKLPWKKLGLLLLIWIVGTVLIVQVFYPGNKLLPYQNIDGLALGGNTYQQAAERLDAAYADKKIEVFLQNNSKPVSSPKLAEAGIKVSNSDRLKQYIYPWYLRLVPSSIFWAGGSKAEPKVEFTNKTDDFITTKLMKECQVAPVDATLKAEGDKLSVVSAKAGGECNPETVKKEFTAVKPVLNQATKVSISVKELPFEVANDEAKAAGDIIMARVGEAVPLSVNGQNIGIAPSDFYAWLEFTPNQDTVEATVSGAKAQEYLAKNITPKVAVAPGTATVTTRDFAEVSRTGGGDGQTLNIDATVRSLNDFLSRQSTTATAVPQSVPANITYVRTYSSTDEGLNALLSNYAKDHAGTYGISYAELSGDRRRANYQGDKKFVTASTYKLFVAYSVLKRVESGQMSWEDNQTCFNKMISQSDNPCSEAFLQKVGLGTITKEINAMGLKNSNFTQSGGPFTTANDLVTFLGTLESGNMFSSTSRSRLISAMNGNVYRKGVPAGASGQVADKVGFMDGLLHDAAIVYSPKGTYVLAVMTDGSTWDNIAGLTRELEKLR